MSAQPQAQTAELGRHILLCANSGIQARISGWEKKMADESAPVPPPANKEEYGHPVPGSLTDQRGKQAAEWVDHEIDRLCEEIIKIGKFDPDEGGVATTTFGELFTHYVDISNSVVGILRRAKKRHRVKFGPDMLFQHAHKEVKITVLQ